MSYSWTNDMMDLHTTFPEMSHGDSLKRRRVVPEESLTCELNSNLNAGLGGALVRT